MIVRVGRFEVDTADAPAVSHLIRCAWVPRSRREVVGLRVASGLRHWRAGGVQALGAPDLAAGAAPSRIACAEAVREAMGEDLATGLHLLPAAAPAPARRVVFGWRGETLAVVAKVAASGEPSLAHEAAALRELEVLPAAVRELAPRLLAHVHVAGLEVLATSALPGMPLLRSRRDGLRMRPWQRLATRDLADWLAALHLATGRGGEALRHGDLWSRNVLVDAAGRLSGVVDWEAASHGDPVDDIARFLVASADAELAARGAACERARSTGDGLVAWMLAPGGRGGAAMRELWSRWSAEIARAPRAPTTERLARAIERELARRGLALGAEGRALVETLA